jgi:UDP-N-acetylglucosamine--N-acetylmuramyl-(pentapeptide) pyrophosphoryl-undecaprenol N-acetylglucosamine transferase
MGGSRGAHALNEIGARALVHVHANSTRFQVTHLTGVSDVDAVREKYQQAGVDGEVHMFVHDMAKIYSACDFVISRAGAATCAELLAFGVPSLLIPYPSAVRDHQSANARAMERMGAAQVIAERELTEDWLADYVADIIAKRASLEKMRAAALAQANLDAADALADLVINVAGGRHVA